METEENVRLPSCWMCDSLSNDPHLVICETPTSIAKLNRDQYFPGYTFVVLKRHEVELYNLSDRERRSFLEDMSTVAKALALAVKPDKMNYELLGNGQPHMHWHLVPRYRSEPLWGRPIWTGPTRRRKLDAESYADLVNRIRKHLNE